MSNVLLMYYQIKRLGIPDERIILMNGMDVLCDARNVYPGRVFASTRNNNNLCDDSVEIDYHDEDVTAENFLNVLTGRNPHARRGQRLRSDSSSNVLVFLTGHGGDEFMKFHDTEEISSHDLAYALHEMHVKRRYRKLLLILDTCQAATIANHITAPNITIMSSSLKGENSYSYFSNDAVGVSVIDRFVYSVDKFFREQVSSNRHSRTGALTSSVTFEMLRRDFDTRFLRATPVITSTDVGHSYMKQRLVEYFGDTLPQPHPVVISGAMDTSIEEGDVDQLIDALFTT